MDDDTLMDLLIKTTQGMIWQCPKCLAVLGKKMNAQLMGMFAKAADCKNAKEWLNYMSREVINLLCNEEILYQIK